MEETFPKSMTMSPDTVPFEEIFRDHQARVYRVLWCELRDDDAAATLTQECFLKAYKAFADFRGESSVATWLTRIAVNLAHDYRKSRRQGFWRGLFGPRSTDLESVEEIAPDHSPGAERALLAREELQRTLDRVNTLSPQQRTVFHLRFLEEMSLEEIATTMNLEVGTVKAHLARAVGSLRERRKEATNGSPQR